MEITSTPIPPSGVIPHLHAARAKADNAVQRQRRSTVELFTPLSISPSTLDGNPLLVLLLLNPWFNQWMDGVVAINKIAATIRFFFPDSSRAGLSHHEPPKGAQNLTQKLCAEIAPRVRPLKGSPFQSYLHLALIKPFLCNRSLVQSMEGLGGFGCPSTISRQQSGRVFFPDSSKAGPSHHHLTSPPPRPRPGPLPQAASFVLLGTSVALIRNALSDPPLDRQCFDAQVRQPIKKPNPEDPGFQKLRELQFFLVSSSLPENSSS